MLKLHVSEMSTGQTNVLERGMPNQHRTQLSTAQKANMKKGLCYTLPREVKPEYCLYFCIFLSRRGDIVDVVISNGASSVLRSRSRLKSKCLSDIIVEPHD